MVCKKCGNQLPDGEEKLCPNCGEPVSMQESTSNGANAEKESLAEKKQKPFEKYKKYIITAIIAIVAVIVVISIISSAGGDAIESLKGIVFDEFGTATLGDAAEKNLSNLKWESEKINDNEHTVRLDGYSTEYMTKLAIEFDVTFVDDMAYASASKVWVDGEEYTDYSSICYVMEIIYE